MYLFVRFLYLVPIFRENDLISQISIFCFTRFIVIKIEIIFTFFFKFTMKILIQLPWCSLLFSLLICLVFYRQNDVKRTSLNNVIFYLYSYVFVLKKFSLIFSIILYHFLIQENIAYFLRVASPRHFFKILGQGNRSKWNFVNYCSTCWN